MENRNNNSKPKITQYMIGFVLSLVLTFASYFLVVNKVLTGTILIATTLMFAVAQLCIQLMFFLHLMDEKKPRWNLIMVLSTIGMILLLIIGAIWIIKNLNYNMSPTQMNQHIMENEGMHY